MNPYAHGHSKNRATMLAGVLMFGLSLSALYSVGLVPDYVDGTGTFAKDDSPKVTQALPDENDQLALADIPRLGDEPVLQPMSALEAAAAELRAEMGDTTSAVEPVLPTRIVINNVSIDLPVLNPESTSVEVLDEELHSGVVRYPLSAELNEDGNIFIFGHSSHLPVVHNQMYKAFNDIETLKVGDTIKLIGSGETHLYHVTSVRQTTADEALIDLSKNGTRRLTLSTCDSFGGKSSRWVVEAEWVGAI